VKIQVEVSGPNKQRQVWRLPLDSPVGQYVATVASRMGLPTRLNWCFVPRATGKPLGSDETLGSAGIEQGAELELRPVRSKLLKLLAEELYGEAQGYAQDELWQQALDKLEALHAYDPRFPDPLGLQQLAQAGVAPSLISTGTVSWGLVLGGLAVVGAAAVTAAAVAGGGALLVWQLISGGSGPRPHSGDVQITLEWSDRVDLDLHVYDPYRDHVYFGNRQVASGGELDVDANHPCTEAVASPLENVYWPRGGAPDGEYEVHVRYFHDCIGAGAVSYRVTVRVDDRVLDVFSATISPQEDVFITSFEY
jgi:hypothetical protein